MVSLRKYFAKRRMKHLEKRLDDMPEEYKPSITSRSHNRGDFYVRWPKGKGGRENDTVSEMLLDSLQGEVDEYRRRNKT